MKKILSTILFSLACIPLYVSATTYDISGTGRCFSTKGGEPDLDIPCWTISGQAVVNDSAPINDTVSVYVTRALTSVDSGPIDWCVWYPTISPAIGCDSTTMSTFGAFFGKPVGTIVPQHFSEGTGVLQTSGTPGSMAFTLTTSIVTNAHLNLSWCRDGFDVCNIGDISMDIPITLTSGPAASVNLQISKP